MADAGALPIWDELNWDTVTGLYTERKATSDAMRGLLDQDDKAEQFTLLSFGPEQRGGGSAGNYSALVKGDASYKPILDENDKAELQRFARTVAACQSVSDLVGVVEGTRPFGVGASVASELAMMLAGGRFWTLNKKTIGGRSLVLRLGEGATMAEALEYARLVSSSEPPLRLYREMEPQMEAMAAAMAEHATGLDLEGARFIGADCVANTLFDDLIAQK